MNSFCTVTVTFTFVLRPAKAKSLLCLPRLTNTISASSSSSSHSPAQIQNQPLQCAIDETILSKVYEHSRPPTWQDEMGYSTEADVQFRVRELLECILQALKLQHLTICSEISVFQSRPDLWLLYKSIEGHSYPIGVIEVKKPNSALKNDSMCGQLYDYLRMLIVNFNLNFAIGILTNFHEWQVAWLPEKDGNIIASQEIRTESQNKSEHIDGITPITIPYCNNVSGEEAEDNTALDDNAASEDNAAVGEMLPRMCSGTNVIHNSSPEKVLKLLVITISKMCAAVMPLHTTLISPAKQYFLHTPNTFFWVPCPWKENDSLDYTEMPQCSTKNFYLLKAVGQGLHSKVWLACSKSLKVCAIKFYHYHVTDATDKANYEAKMWKKLGFIKSRRVILASKPALVMQYLVPCNTEILQNFKDMATAAINKLANHDLCHNDIKLDNMGYYEDTSGVQISFLDLGSVVKCNKPEALHHMNAQLEKILSSTSASLSTPARRRLKRIQEQL